MSCRFADYDDGCDFPCSACYPGDSGYTTNGYNEKPRLSDLDSYIEEENRRVQRGNEFRSRTQSYAPRWTAADRARYDRYVWSRRVIRDGREVAKRKLEGMGAPRFPKPVADPKDNLRPGVIPFKKDEKAEMYRSITRLSDALSDLIEKID